MPQQPDGWWAPHPRVEFSMPPLLILLSVPYWLLPLPGAAAAVAICGGQAVVAGGVTYKTTVFLEQGGFPAKPFVSLKTPWVNVSVKATLAATGAPFPFEFANPYKFTLPPKKDVNGVVGFDVGLAPTAQPVRCGSAECGMTTGSMRTLCIPPEEGYGSAPREGIPGNSTLIIEIKCIEILQGPPPPPMPPAPPPPPPPPPPSGKCDGGLAASDCEAWIDLYDRTGGTNWTHCSGNRLSPCSCLCPSEICAGAMNPIFTDHGDPPVRVTCGYVDKNLTASITELTLGRNNLVGDIPASIGNLSSKLMTLGIFYNPGLAGSSIPSSVGRLTGLKEAYLYSNGLTGEIPASIGNATALRVLLLADNALTGIIPASFSRLAKVSWLELQHNRLTGTVPALSWASTQGMGQCSLDAVGARPRGHSSPSITGRCTEPNCNKFACPLPEGSDQCFWGSRAGVHCRNRSGSSINGGYGGLGRHDGSGDKGTR
jgi:hypothetical protein